jgi:hypothetical protein
MGTINRENAGPGTELNRRPQPFQGCVLPAYPFVLQLNFAERPQFCDHSVTSADVRLASAPNLTRAACQRPVDLASLGGSAFLNSFARQGTLPRFL